MKNRLNNEVYEAEEVANFRELVNRSAEKYPNNVAYKFKSCIAYVKK